VKFQDETKAFAFAVMNTQLAGVDFSHEQLEELDKLFYVSFGGFSAGKQALTSSIY
jgi:hypothetical protein